VLSTTAEALFAIPWELLKAVIGSALFKDFLLRRNNQMHLGKTKVI
jgi:hypothetical protein